MKTAILIAGLAATVTCEFVEGFDNTTYPVVVNGTTFNIYDSVFPVSYEWIRVSDKCSYNDPTTCAYKGENYCCGTWRINDWYQTDLSFRISQIAYGNSWYAVSYFNSFSGF